MRDPNLEKKEKFILQKNRETHQQSCKKDEKDENKKCHHCDVEYPPEEMRTHVQRLNIKKGLLKKDAFLENVMRRGKSDLLEFDVKERAAPFQELFDKIQKQKENENKVVNNNFRDNWKRK